MKVELTTDFILRYCTDDFHFEDYETVCLLTDDEGTNFHYVNLAFETLGIAYQCEDYRINENKFNFGFVFKLEDVKNECPGFYKEYSEYRCIMFKKQA